MEDESGYSTQPQGIGNVGIDNKQKKVDDSQNPISSSAWTKKGFHNTFDGQGNTFEQQTSKIAVRDRINQDAAEMRVAGKFAGTREMTIDDVMNANRGMDREQAEYRLANLRLSGKDRINLSADKKAETPAVAIPALNMKENQTSQIPEATDENNLLKADQLSRAEDELPFLSNLPGDDTDISALGDSIKAAELALNDASNNNKPRIKPLEKGIEPAVDPTWIEEVIPVTIEDKEQKTVTASERPGAIGDKGEQDMEEKFLENVKKNSLDKLKLNPTLSEQIVVDGDLVFISYDDDAESYFVRTLQSNGNNTYTPVTRWMSESEVVDIYRNNLKSQVASESIDYSNYDYSQQSNQTSVEDQAA